MMEAGTPLQPAVAQLPRDAPAPAAGHREYPRVSPQWAWLALAAVILFGVIQTAVRYAEHHLGLHGDMYGFLLEHEGLGPTHFFSRTTRTCRLSRFSSTAPSSRSPGSPAPFPTSPSTWR